MEQTGSYPCLFGVDLEAPKLPGLGDSRGNVEYKAALRVSRILGYGRVPRNFLH